MGNESLWPGETGLGCPCDRAAVGVSVDVGWGSLSKLTYSPLPRSDSRSKVMQYSHPESCTKMNCSTGPKATLVLPPRGRLLWDYTPYTDI